MKPPGAVNPRWDNLERIEIPLVGTSRVLNAVASTNTARAVLILGGSTRAPITFLLVDHQSSPKFVAERGWIVVDQCDIPIFDNSIRSRDICDQSLKLSEITPNFSRFWPQIIFGGGPPKFWNLGYKTEHISDHVTKFHVHRQRDLGDLVVKKENDERKETAAVQGGVKITIQ